MRESAVVEGVEWRAILGYTPVLWTGRSSRRIGRARSLPALTVSFGPVHIPLCLANHLRIAPLSRNSSCDQTLLATTTTTTATERARDIHPSEPDRGSSYYRDWGKKRNAVKSSVNIQHPSIVDLTIGLLDSPSCETFFWWLFCWLTGGLTRVPKVNNGREVDVVGDRLVMR